MMACTLHLNGWPSRDQAHEQRCRADDTVPRRVTGGLWLAHLGGEFVQVSGSNVEEGPDFMPEAVSVLPGFEQMTCTSGRSP
jgi:hypothetical protein